MVAHQLQEAPVELPLFADEYRVNRGAHVVVNAALTGALVKLERLFVRVEHHLLGLARIGAHERHPAVAKANLRHLGLRRYPGEDDNLMAPVELVGFPWREDQGHVGDRRALALPFRPCPSVTTHGVVAASVPTQPKLGKYALIGQSLALGQSCVLAEQLLQRRNLVAQLGSRLIPAHIVVLGSLFAANDLSHRIACKLQITRDRLDLPLLNEVRPTNLRDRIHSHHPPLDPLRESRTRGRFTTRGVGSNLHADHPRKGVKIARLSTVRGQGGGGHRPRPSEPTDRELQRRYRPLRSQQGHSALLQNLFSKLARPKDLARGSVVRATELGPAPDPRRPMLPGARVVIFAVRLREEFSRLVGSESRLEMLPSGLAAI